MRTKSLQSCLSLCNPMDCNPPDSSIHESLQARILEYVVVPSSRRSSWPKDQTPCLLCLLHWQAGSVAQLVKNPQATWETWVWVLGWEHPLEKGTATIFCPGEFHRPRTLAGYSPWDLEESDTTERLHFHFSLSRIGEGNGNPLQCSCLENPRDGRAW